MDQVVIFDHDRMVLRRTTGPGGYYKRLSAGPVRELSTLFSNTL